MPIVNEGCDFIVKNLEHSLAFVGLFNEAEQEVPTWVADQLKQRIQSRLAQSRQDGETDLHEMMDNVPQEYPNPWIYPEGRFFDGENETLLDYDGEVGFWFEIEATWDRLTADRSADGVVANICCTLPIELGKPKKKEKVEKKANLEALAERMTKTIDAIKGDLRGVVTGPNKDGQYWCEVPLDSLNLLRLPPDQPDAINEQIDRAVDEFMKAVAVAMESIRKVEFPG